jgi:hypothetical protein
MQPRYVITLGSYAATWPSGSNGPTAPNVLHKVRLLTPDRSYSEPGLFPRECWWIIIMTGKQEGIVQLQELNQWVLFGRINCFRGINILCLTRNEQSSTWKFLSILLHNIFLVLVISAGVKTARTWLWTPQYRLVYLSAYVSMSSIINNW